MSIAFGMLSPNLSRPGLWTAAATVLLLAAGCDGGPPTKTKSIKVSQSNPFHERLTSLSELDRSLTLRRAIQDAGQSCRKIESSAHQGEFKALQMWTARCSGNRDWAVFIAPNGDVQVRSCAEAQELGLPACRPAES